VSNSGTPHVTRFPASDPKLEGVEAASDYLTRTMSQQKSGPDGGSVTLLRPGGSAYPGSPFKGGGPPGPWAVVVDGNDNVWISNFAGAQIATMLLAVGVLGYASVPATAAVRIEGQVQAGGGPLANSTVTLWGASAGEPRQLAQVRTSSDGRFELGSQETLGTDVILYLVAKGGEASVNKGSSDNPAVALLSVLGNTPAPRLSSTRRPRWLRYGRTPNFSMA